MKHDICTQTMGIVDRNDPEQGFKLLAEAGFTSVDFGVDEFVQGPHIRRGMVNDEFDVPFEELLDKWAYYKAAADKYGIRFGQMHAVFPVLQVEYPELTEDYRTNPDKSHINNMTMRTAENCIRLCGAWDCRYIVVHPVTLAHTPKYTRQYEHDYNVDMYKRLIPVALESKVMICLENMFVSYHKHMTEGYCSDFREAADLVDELNSIASSEFGAEGDVFGFCLDVGHANLLGKNLHNTVLTLGKRLTILHVHDNDGIMDMHTIPFAYSRTTENGLTDWYGFLKGLAEVDYSNHFNFETFKFFRAIPKALHPAGLKFVAETGEYFYGVIDDLKKGVEPDPETSGWLLAE